MWIVMENYIRPPPADNAQGAHQLQTEEGEPRKLPASPHGNYIESCSAGVCHVRR
jgi:hypothetical protein